MADNNVPVQWWNPLSWGEWVVGQWDSWLTGLGGQIGSGIESGFVTFAKDMWKVIKPYVFIAIGLFLVMSAVTLYFKDDLIAAAQIAASAAGGAAKAAAA